MRKSPLYLGPRAWQPSEVSIEDCKAAAISYANWVGDDDVLTDPFDIVAQLEEELGHPLNQQ